MYNLNICVSTEYQNKHFIISLTFNFSQFGRWEMRLSYIIPYIRRIYVKLKCDQQSIAKTDTIINIYNFSE